RGRGNPSRRNPFFTAGSRSSMRPMTRSSGTSLPSRMMGSAFLPSSGPAATASRRRSPGEVWVTPTPAASFSACVPLPEPAAPRNPRFIAPPGAGLTVVIPVRLRSGTGAAAADAGAAGAGEALVVAGDEMALDLLNCIEGHAHHDEQSRTAEEE